MLGLKNDKLSSDLKLAGMYSANKCYFGIVGALQNPSCHLQSGVGFALICLNSGSRWISERSDVNGVKEPHLKIMAFKNAKSSWAGLKCWSIASLLNQYFDILDTGRQICSTSFKKIRSNRPAQGIEDSNISCCWLGPYRSCRSVKEWEMIGLRNLY